MLLLSSAMLLMKGTEIAILMLPESDRRKGKWEWEVVCTRLYDYQEEPTLYFVQCC